MAISGVSSGSTTPVRSPTAEADAALGKLLKSTDVMKALPEKGALSEIRTVSTVNSLVWKVLNPKNKPNITREDVEAAVTKLGGSKKGADALWTQLAGKKISIASADFSLNMYVGGTIKASLASLQTAASADRSLESILGSQDFIGALAVKSTRWTLPSQAQTLSLLWGVFNLDGTSRITKENVALAVKNYGGSTEDVNILWARMDPEGKGFMNAGDFAKSTYLRDSIAADQEDIQAVVSEYLLLQGPSKKASVLGGFQMAGGAGSLYYKDNRNALAAALFNTLI
jgi:hypothetical protein